MKSKVRIGLSEDRRPCIIIEKEYTDDVRDDLVCRFVEDLGYDSKWFELINAGRTNNSNYIIAAVKNLDDLLVDIINQIIKTRQFKDGTPYLQHLTSLLEFINTFNGSSFGKLDISGTSYKVGMTASVPVTYTDGIQPPSTDATK